METIKATQPCYITDYYDKKKRSSNSQGYKKIIITSVHKLIAQCLHLSNMINYMITT
ncbi:hypothetical protein HMPREF0548_0427 [Lactobacillus ultunensis DSM 16047]|uniref:Uncharacterized protein n=1 Tax=Lactobacillus ultunensis DSM 16047 TaxID=525365 RepID=C2EL81_9LACO|nr:hypothetical protein HMPREF0548_0427 [Lactobacillus ultunensis DSM 16047]